MVVLFQNAPKMSDPRGIGNTAARARGTRAVAFIAVLSATQIFIMLSAESSFSRWTQQHDKLTTLVDLMAQQHRPNSVSVSKVAPNQPYHYSPSALEQYFIDNANALDLYNTEGVSTCPIIFNDTSPINKDMLDYFKELDAYKQAVSNFSPIEYDLRTAILPDESNIEEVCNVTKIHPDGLGGIFSSPVSSSTHHGGMEPLLPVMRSEKICSSRKHLMSMDYLVHDFYSMCKRLKYRSRTIFIDMGASLQFHGNADSPAVYINRIYKKFGFWFDHIYSYEITQTAPAKVFEKVPEDLMNSYHWINVGVDPEPGAKMNPFTTLLKHFNAEDFVVVKLDIDNALIENQLANQLRNGTSAKKLLDVVDVFYYEHHVKQRELMGDWARTGTIIGSVGNSLEMMKDIRENGVASHYWP